MTNADVYAALGDYGVDEVSTLVAVTLSEMHDATVDVSGDVDVPRFVIRRDGEELELLGFVGKLREPREVAGQVMRWRAWFDGKWIDIPRKRDFLSVYQRLHTREEQ